MESKLQRLSIALMLGLIMLIGMTFTASTKAWAAGLTTNEKLADYDQLVSRIRSGYGPFFYKSQHSIIDVDGIIASYRQKIAATTNNSDFYYLIRRFVAEFRDGHFRASLPTDHVAMLPIGTDLVNGEVLITSIDPQWQAVSGFDYNVGDKILAIEDRSINDFLNDYSRLIGSGFEQTERRQAAWLTFTRPARLVPAPTGKFNTLIYSYARNRKEKVTMTWLESGEALDENPDFIFEPQSAHSVKRDFFQLDIMDTLQDFPKYVVDRSFMCNPGTRIAIPENAQMITTPDTPFVAYIYPTAKGNIGYLRIPHYMPQTAIGEWDGEARFAQYEKAIQVLEKYTVGLIIDQDHNCGGSVEWLEKLMGLFMNEPYKPAMFELLANKEEYLSFKLWATEVPTFSVAADGLNSIIDLVKLHWLAGDWMTPKVGISGVEMYQPNHIRYTKPIVMTIDEMSGSGGDLFPSLMKGYGRAKLVGTRTSGLGGHVTEQSPLYNSQIPFRMTKSLFYRPDGVAVENNGAVPDYPYTITREDILSGFVNYREFYTQKLLDLL